MHTPELITELAESGRQPTDDELRQIREHVAAAGFDPDARERVRGRGAGVVWRGRALRGGDRLRPAEAHYARHVLADPEWPTGTTLQDYLESVRQIVNDQASGVFLSRYHGMLQIRFIGRSGEWKGARGHNWILVEFRQDLDHITTAFQVDTPENVVEQAQRSATRWLRNPR